MKKIGVIFGGMSTENEVSIKSAEGVLGNLDRSKYEIHMIYIDKNGNWNRYIGKQDTKEINFRYMQKINNVMEYIKQLDVVFPVLHGLYGEDGTIQGLLELLKVPYIGCKVLASAIGIDKVYTKIIFEKAGLKQAKYIYIKKEEDVYAYVDEYLREEKTTIEKICENVYNELKFPMFVKPSNFGSSVGVSKVNNIEELKEAIAEAGKYDKKILIEQGIDGKEIECAVLQDNEIITSCLGEVIPAEEFYSYEAKYIMQESKTIIPAKITEQQETEIKEQAIRAFKAIDGIGLSRVDFFIENVTGEIYINEINTLPGFTQISMYPQLFEKSGIEYSELLDKLIENASTTKDVQ